MRRRVAAFVFCFWVSPALAVEPAAKPSWMPIGRTSMGQPVSIDPGSIETLSEGMKIATVRVVYPEAIETPKGKMTSLVAKARFDCARRLVAGDEVVMYADEAAGKALVTQRDPNARFGREAAGTFGDVALAHLCGPAAP